MAQVERSVATLRIIGDDLDPAGISRLLGCESSEAETRGQHIVGKSGKVRVAKKGIWRLYAADRTPEDLDGQIAELLSQLTDDLEVWKSLAANYRVELFCGLFMKGRNEGLSIAPKSLAALGLRGIELGLDIYAGDGEKEGGLPEFTGAR